MPPLPARRRSCRPPCWCRCAGQATDRTGPTGRCGGAPASPPGCWTPTPVSSSTSGTTATRTPSWSARWPTSGARGRRCPRRTAPSWPNVCSREEPWSSLGRLDAPPDREHRPQRHGSGAQGVPGLAGDELVVGGGARAVHARRRRPVRPWSALPAASPRSTGGRRWRRSAIRRAAGTASGEVPGGLRGAGTDDARLPAPRRRTALGGAAGRHPRRRVSRKGLSRRRRPGPR